MGKEGEVAGPGFVLVLFLIRSWTRVSPGPVSLDEGVREAFDGHGPGQAGLTHVGGTPPFQLPLTSEQSQAIAQG